MRIIIAGTRTFDDYPLLKREMDRITWKFCKLTILTGGQRKWMAHRRTFIGADYLGEKWALENGFVVLNFHPDWNKYGKRAGPLRNEEMIRAAGEDSMLVAFWDLESPGTQDVIERARFRDMTVKIIPF